MITISFPYKSISQEFYSTFEILQKEFSSIVHFSYNRFKDDFSQNEIRNRLKNLNNIHHLNSWIKECAICEGKYIFNKNKDKKVIFGGKKNFFLRQNNKISKEEFKEKKLSFLSIQGEKYQKGNRNFKLDIENNKIIFKYSKHQHFELQLPKLRNNVKKKLLQLQLLNENKIGYTYSIKLSKSKIYITFDDFIDLKYQNLPKKENRFLSIDLNPNYLGYSIIDWNSDDDFKLIHSGVFSLKTLNDQQFDLNESSNHKKNLYFNNKRNHFIIEISKSLINLCKEYDVKHFCIEKLQIQNKNHQKGKNFNRLINNYWCRNLFYEQISKRCKIHGVLLHEILPQYSSFIGNIVYKDLELPDMCLSSIEISRRGYLFNEIYIKKKLEKKSIIFPTNFKLKELKMSLEECFGNLNINLEEGWKGLYSQIKNSKMRYRISLNDCKKSFEVFRLKNKKSMIDKISFQL